MGLIDFVIDLAERCAKAGKSKDGLSPETEEEIRKIAIASLFPSDYVEYEYLSDPILCTIITEKFVKSAKQCAKEEKDILCNIRRRKFIRCEAIRKEVERMRNPVIEGEK